MTQPRTPWYIRSISTFAIPVFALALLSLTTVDPTSAAVFIVDTAVDELDGSCNDDCSLRDAVALANANPNFDEIVLAAETYQLNLVGTGDAAGDLDLLHPVLIRGVDAEQTIIEQTVANERVVDVLASGKQAVKLRDLCITGGSVDSGQGGGMLAGSDLKLERVKVENNSSDFAGGGLGIENDAEVEIVASRFLDNTAGLSGGHINGQAGALRILSTSVFSADSSTMFGSVVVDVNNGVLEIDGSTFDVGSEGFLQIGLTGSVGAIRNSTLVSPLSLNDSFNSSSASIVHSTLAEGGSSLFLPALSVTVETEIERSVIIGDCGLGTSDDLTSVGFNVHTETDCFDPQPSDQVSVDPGDLFLGPLQDNGGATETFAITDGASVLIGPETALCPLSFDQRGVPRNACDIGAYEREAACFEPVSPLAIPDNDSTGVSFGIGTSEVKASDLQVLVDIEHPFVGDLKLVLEGPGGEEVVLLNQPSSGACEGEDVVTFFDQGAELAADSACRSVAGTEAFPRSSYQPLGDLTTLNGIEGTWTATVSDLSSGDTGSVRRICLVTASGAAVFADGFESGDTNAWSSTRR